ncbi:MAG: error-prone DNA polymerase, partial [Dinoroseobacter sp.]|nr:error-prone DNA polymerase [Dinoroseobacter sp.]
MFAELSALSNFSFLTGASHPEEYIDRAGLLGLSAVAIADENSVAGIVRAYTRGKEIARLINERAALEARDGLIGPMHPAPASQVGADIARVPRLIPAAKLVLTDGLVITVLPETRTGWSALSRLLSLGRRRAPKGDCELSLADVLEGLEACQMLLHGSTQAQADACAAGTWWTQAERLAHRFGPKLSLLMAPVYDGRDPGHFDRLAALADRLGIPTVASAAPRMHIARRRRLADVLTAVRTGTRVDDLGRAATANAEQRLRSEAEMRRLFRGHGDAVKRAAEIAARCSFCLSELRYDYPSEVQNGEAPQDRLARLTQDGLVWRYPSGIPDRVQKLAQHELALIAKLGYAPYFLTVRDIVAFARSRDILCQGRGSAANSVVCFALGITSVSPEIGTMVFERFVSEARDEPPDIDVDFEHERREEVIQHIYERYGRERAGLCATVIHYRGKRAVREVGRAMGLTEDTLAALSSQIWGFGSVRGIEEERLREIGLDPADRRLRQTIELIYEIQGFPRHLSQHVGGFVLT